MKPDHGGSRNRIARGNNKSSRSKSRRKGKEKRGGQKAKVWCGCNGYGRDCAGRYSPRQYLGYTAVRYPELSGNVARSDAAVRQLDDPLPHYIR